MTYLIIDSSNLFMRSRHVVRGDIDAKIGMALHITLSSIRKVWHDFDGSHVVFCCEGRSWRKSFYEPYKRNRADRQAALTEEEVEEDKLFWESYNEFIGFLNERTNCTVLQHPQLEADDLIAGFIQQHPNDKHIIISTDSDFYQLISDNVSQYNGVNEQLITVDGFFDAKGKRVKDNKTNEVKEPINPQWELFYKCIRGDTSDNVFSAYPGVRVKGTKNKVGLLEAFADRDDKGYAWNALMLSKFNHHDGTEHLVMDDYKRNVTLIDLTAQPDNIKEHIVQTISSIETKQNPQIGVYFLKFCGKFDLQRLAESASAICECLASGYQRERISN